ncbi:hypothetical protein C0Q70_04155 [Pomacea canaliculata]|uniref:Guanine nucleotide-binding protein G(s) subunit alpha n=1 Tax=Pomacea canaliculata TaxID=400727 RepID=A0A2T7PUT6_POMCA|nr:hypothetical protein C0Q70_04155 [Pomacea canaliculata]
MHEQVMACFGSCVDAGGASRYYDNPEAAKQARLRDKQLSKLLHKYHKEDLKRLKLLLLGTGESGKSTITKQMRIIHINGFTNGERITKIGDIIRNIRESILSIVVAMHQFQMSLEKEENRQSYDFILSTAGDPEPDVTEEFWDHVQRLWADRGVQECHDRSYEFQLMDSAKYFLDKVPEIRLPGYIPSDQDILRCRVITTSIQHIEFDVPDAGQHVRFSVYDVGGQRGERKKWIQVFDSVVAILYLADSSGFDQTLREDPSKNRLLETLEIFEQVWNNRFLRMVSVLLFLNKIDILAEKLTRGRSIRDFIANSPVTLPDYESFMPTNGEKSEFMEAFPGGSDAPRRRGRSSSRTDIDPEVTKTAVYIKHLFMVSAQRVMGEELRVEGGGG